MIRKIDSEEQHRDLEHRPRLDVAHDAPHLPSPHPGASAPSADGVGVVEEPAPGPRVGSCGGPPTSGPSVRPGRGSARLGCIDLLDPGPERWPCSRLARGPGLGAPGSSGDITASVGQALSTLPSTPRRQPSRRALASARRRRAPRPPTRQAPRPATPPARRRWPRRPRGRFLPFGRAQPAAAARGRRGGGGALLARPGQRHERQQHHHDQPSAPAPAARPVPRLVLIARRPMTTSPDPGASAGLIEWGSARNGARRCRRRRKGPAPPRRPSGRRRGS